MSYHQTLKSKIEELRKTIVFSALGVSEISARLNTSEINVVQALKEMGCLYEQIKWTDGVVTHEKIDNSKNL